MASPVDDARLCRPQETAALLRRGLLLRVLFVEGSAYEDSAAKRGICLQEHRATSLEARE